jgi:N-dimethylarginine dimethylaminohydrolase
MLRKVNVCRAVHAFVRPPFAHNVPATGPNGVVISRDALMQQFREFYRTLQQSTLVDKLHVMAERHSFDSIRAADQLACVGSTFLAMPITGSEQRITEYMESMRYVRNAGGPTTLASYLQDVDGCRCHSGDIVVLPTGIAVGSSARTNAVAHQVLKQLFTVREEHSTFDVVTMEQEGDAPPLGDYFGFAGTNTLLTWKDEHGMLAVDQYQAARPNDTLQVVYLEPGCNFLSFYGTDQSNDVIVQKGMDRSIESLVAAGLNPIPVQWSELDKMGVSMRSAVLVMKFLKQAVGNVVPRNKARAARWQAHQLK